eukprot:Gb_28716 [translate_table: standard]
MTLRILSLLPLPMPPPIHHESPIAMDGRCRFAATRAAGGSLSKPATTSLWPVLPPDLSATHPYSATHGRSPNTHLSPTAATRSNHHQSS